MKVTVTGQNFLYEWEALVKGTYISNMKVLSETVKKL